MLTTTKKLMDAGQVANLKIICCMLNYKDAERKLIKGMTYQERDTIGLLLTPERNEIIKTLTTGTRR